MSFFLRRLMFYVIALFFAATLNFILPRMMPGDPVTMMFANAMAHVSQKIEAMKKLLGFVDGRSINNISLTLPIFSPETGAHQSSFTLYQSMSYWEVLWDGLCF